MERIHQFKTEGRTIVVVSHAADVMRPICDRVAVIDAGALISVAQPGEAIRAFRDGLIETGDAATPLPALEDTGPVPIVDHPVGWTPDIVDRRVAITGCRIELPAEPERTHVLPGEGITVVLDLKVRQPLPNVAFGCSVFAADGNLLFDCDSAMVGERHDLVPGISTVLFQLSELPLLDGRYTINVRVQETGGGTRSMPARSRPATSRWSTRAWATGIGVRSRSQ